MVKSKWTIEPDLESVKQVVQAKLISKEVDVTFLTQGAFNKIYNVRIDRGDFIMRVSLPIDPRWKTLSEVATLAWVRDNTSLPVPRILAYDASQEIPVGFEWMLMSKIPGRTLSDAWRSTDFKSKKEVVQQLAIFFSSLFRQQLRGIGNLYPESDGPDVKALQEGNNIPEVARVVSTEFFYGTRISQPVPRGPFKSSKDWMEVCLLCSELDMVATITTLDQKENRNEDEEIELKMATRTLAIINRLKPLIGDFFPSIEEPEFACCTTTISMKLKF